MGWIPDEIVDSLRKSSILGIFIRMDTDPPLRLWFGVNDIEMAMSYVEEEEAVYLGGGQLNGVPNIEVPINGVADRVDFIISGIDPATAASVMDSIPAVRGADFHIGTTTLDEYYQPLSPIIPLMRGVASGTSERSESASGDEKFTTSVALSVGFGSVTRSRKSASIWSQAQQKALYPTDDFCKNTARQARGTLTAWPRL